MGDGSNSRRPNVPALCRIGVRLAELWLAVRWARNEYEAGLRIGRIQGFAEAITAMLENPHQEVHEKAEAVARRKGLL